jgi:hypothetical protein
MTPKNNDSTKEQKSLLVLARANKKLSIEVSVLHAPAFVS